MASSKKATGKKATGKKATGKKVAKRASTAVANVTDYGEDEGAGFEGMSRDDFAIPFLGILHKMSPQCDADDGRHIRGAKPGMIFNTVTGALYPEGIVVIPCHRTQHFIEWVPRDSGGGLVSVHDPHEAMVVEAREGQRFGAIPLENGNELVETFSVFALVVLEDGSYDQVIITFTSSRIKNYKQWMTRATSLLVKASDNRNVRPPLWAHRYEMTTRKQQNDKGTWHDFLIDFEGGDAEDARLGMDDELYLAARAFRSMAMADAMTAVAKQDQSIEDGDAEVM